MWKKKRAFFGINKIKPFMFVILASACFMVGCSSNYQVDRNTVFVQENGKIVTVDVDEFDESRYSKKELESYIQECIDIYNEKQEDSVKKERLSVKDNSATLVLEFADQTTYKEFYGTEFFAGTVAQAVEEGYSFDVAFAKFSDGKVFSCEVEDILSAQEELKVVILKADTAVEVEGEILYLSTDNIAELEKNCVVIQSGSQISDLEIYNSEDDSKSEETQQTQDTEQIQETEDDAVGEDELLITTEETAQLFDFGETEEVASSSNQVYTYIIYK